MPEAIIIGDNNTSEDTKDRVIITPEEYLKNIEEILAKERPDDIIHTAHGGGIHISL